MGELLGGCQGKTPEVSGAWERAKEAAEKGGGQNQQEVRTKVSRVMLPTVGGLELAGVPGNSGLRGRIDG